MKLLPCPFCGADAQYEEIGAQASDGVVFSVGCGDEDCHGYMAFKNSPTKSDVAIAWNKRVELRPDHEAIAAVPQLNGNKALVLYFASDADRDEFAALIHEAKPGMRAVNI